MLNQPFLTAPATFDSYILAQAIYGIHSIIIYIQFRFIIQHVQIQKMQWIELGIMISLVPQGIYILQINLHHSNTGMMSSHSHDCTVVIYMQLQQYDVSDDKSHDNDNNINYNILCCFFLKTNKKQCVQGILKT